MSPSSTGASFARVVDTVNPYTGQVEYRVPLMAGDEVEVRLAAAAQAFPAWAAQIGRAHV